MKLPLVLVRSNETAAELGVSTRSDWVDIRDADGRTIASCYMFTEAENLAHAQAFIDGVNAKPQEGVI